MNQLDLLTAGRAPRVTDAELLALRPAKNPVDPWRPYALLVEEERAASGQVEPVATVFLTNRECPFRCLMCDLWKNTTDEPVPRGAIPAQLDLALQQLPATRHIKLYNSGNFFDRQAIPPADFPAIAARLRGFRTVIVECHPRLVGDDCLRFRDLLGPDQELEVALGLESVHPQVLARLNKQMTLDDFARAAERLTGAGIAVRAFVLLRPPPLDEHAGVVWGRAAVEFAVATGARVVAVIPTRAGNGLLDRWQADGWFSPPRLRSLEAIQEAALAAVRGRGRVFVDLWDLARLSDCAACFDARHNRLDRINRTQQVEPRPDCPNCRSLAGAAERR
ncbi:MAG: radical SAM protein [Pirellulales bacterium]